MCLGVECKYMIRYDTYHMTDITAGNLDSEKELLVSSVLPLAFLGVPVLRVS